MKNSLFDNTYLYASNSVFIEELFEKFRADPNSVDHEWREFFASNEAFSPVPSWHKKTIKIIDANPTILEQKTSQEKTPIWPYKTAIEAKEIHRNQEVYDLDKLRLYGHFAAKLDPLGLEAPKTLEELGIDTTSPNLLVYTSTIGVEFAHVQNLDEQNFLYSKHEEYFSLQFSKEEKMRMLEDLVKIDGLEQYIHKKFPGAKRFSVEGGDSSVVALEEAINHSAKAGVMEVVIGMAHRGRLNTLAKVIGKPYEAVLGEFMGIYSFPKELGIAGDVKYHMGYSNDVTTLSGNRVHLTLTPNPSHLETVNPVAAGRTRAKQDLIGDSSRSKVMTLLVHGDAAFCGQGVVAESLMMSTLTPSDTGGIFHIVVNNQVGFTANPRDGHKSSRYSTEFAKIIAAPIIHVNGDDIEAVSKATRLLSEYRAKYKKDVVLEIFCYRKYGHNEGDEPFYTQPLMYNIIKNKETPAATYAKKLEAEGTIDRETFNSMKDKFKEFMDKAYDLAKDYKPKAQFLEGSWVGYSRFETDQDKNLTTGVEKSKLQLLLDKLVKVPDNFTINSKLQKLFKARLEDFEKKEIVDWATAEQLAFGTLLDEQIPIRLTGQDVARGTFSHRHSVLHDQKTGEKYVPLNNIDSLQAKYEVSDSCLSEYGVLGFEYGYSLSYPKALVIWEAQFGDFSNSAQIVFDQLLSSSETKWLRLSGLVLLMPHSYEGQGPEHTSARLERLLQLCAEDNMIVAYPTTPASIFHLFRRQQLRQVRKPLIIMSPKSIFRNPLAVSPIVDIDSGSRFLEIIPDNLDHKEIKKVILCSGKVYYDLLSERTKKSIKNIAIIRIEQLYPFPVDTLNKELSKYKNSKVVWCQEEPENMGPYQYFYSRILKKLNIENLELVSRKEAASPATGYASTHNHEQEEIIAKALSI